MQKTEIEKIKMENILPTKIKWLKNKQKIVKYLGR